MKGYNIRRPLMLIVVALLTRSLVTNLCLILGASSERASDAGFVAMMIAALVMYNRMNKHRRRK